MTAPDRALTYGPWDIGYSTDEALGCSACGGQIPAGEPACYLTRLEPGFTFYHPACAAGEMPDAAAGEWLKCAGCGEVIPPWYGPLRYLLGAKEGFIFYHGKCADDPADFPPPVLAVHGAELPTIEPPAGMT